MYLSRLETVALYASANLLILLVLAYLVSATRRAHKISLGDGGNEHLTRAMRAHANAAEYIPGGLIGLVLAALLEPAFPTWLMHAAGLSLTIGRISHGYGMHQAGVPMSRRVGTGLTWACYLMLAIGLAYGALAQRL